MNSVNGRQKIFEKIFKEHLKIDTYSKSIESLFSPRLLNKINYKPYYQRNYVWDRNKATYFIESILLGTEIPPLIFFNNNTQIEVIDGRQRFETIQRFIEGNLTLTAKGLYILKQLKKCSFNDLSKKDRSIIETFFDAKLRIIEFGLVNEPPLDKHLEDRVKKEIFSRYNSGITPLRKAEIDNAIYDDDALSNLFKNYLEDNPHIKLGIYDTFLPVQKNIDSPPIASIMSFIRRFLVLPLFPIRHFARGTSRTDILTKLYQKFSDDSIDNESEVINEFFKKIAFLKMVFENSLSNDLSTNRLALESFLWGFGVLDLEEIPYNLSSTLVDSISKFILPIDNRFEVRNNCLCTITYYSVPNDFAFQISCG